MPETEIAGKARFDAIRYAQAWEDADVLTTAMGPRPGATLMSVCASGDNCLALLTLDPARVIAVDLSPAQTACLKLRIAALDTLPHDAFLELLGAVPSMRRADLFDRAVQSLDTETAAFWRGQRAPAVRHGVGFIGRFEGYFRLFRRYLLPLVHGRRTVQAVFRRRPPADRGRFHEDRWTTWRWRLLVRLFFSRPVMGALGRDAAFFDQVSGSVADHVMRRIRHAAVDLDPADNPYLRVILTGRPEGVLPLPWRAEHYDTIRSRTGRVEIRTGALEAVLPTAPAVDGFYLSDIFEYMSPSAFAAAYGRIVQSSRPGARLVYWNMMAPRRVPPGFQDRIARQPALEAAGKAADKAFFYSDFVVEDVVR